jgi:hypothetical protein
VIRSFLGQAPERPTQDLHLPVEALATLAYAQMQAECEALA